MISYCLTSFLYVLVTIIVLALVTVNLGGPYDRK